jgi:F-type H+-transporting ATPase subunit b
MSPRPAYLATLLFGVSFVAPVAMAAGSEGGDPVFTPAGWVYRVFNFLIVAGAVVWVFRKLNKPFRHRAESIAESIQQAARAREEAQQRLRQIEEKWSRIEEEVDAMRALAQKDAAAEAERIRALAREEVRKIERAADAEIESSERAARMELKALAARLAVERAESLIRTQLTPGLHEAVFRSFVQELSRSVN